MGFIARGKGSGPGTGLGPGDGGVGRGLERLTLLLTEEKNWELIKLLDVIKTLW